MTSDETTTTTTTSPPPPRPPPPASVLYVDHANHPAPLSLCYHAASSRRLSSSIDDSSPPSTMTEIDSAYCPRCLSFYDATSAVSSSELGGRCPAMHCRVCPVCRSDLSVSIDVAAGAEGGGGALICSYRCGYCRWSSEEISLTVPVDVGTGGGGGDDEKKKAIETAATKLAKDLDERIVAAGRPFVERFRSSADWWGKKAQEEERRRRHGDVAIAGQSRRGGAAFAEEEGDGPEGWSIETLEATILAKKKEASSMLFAGAEKLQTMSLEDADRAPEATLPESAGSDALPERIPLRSKKVRRCRAELAAGRTGILVKPKLNPLEGDSSLRSGHGQWWKKDSSAIHAVPRVKVVRHGSSSSDSSGGPRRRRRHALLLSVKNPTLGVVRLRFGGPSSSVPYASSSTDATTIGGDDDGRAVLRNVLADAAERVRVDATVIPTTSKAMVPTEIIDLDAVEDAYLEFGRGKKAGTPEEVEKWDQTSVTATAKDAEEEEATTTRCSVRIVATREDEAWAELAVTTTDDATTKSTTAETTHFAAPISLQIEVGNGSWESSYVRPIASSSASTAAASSDGGHDDEGRDFVRLDLIVLWPKT